MTDDELDNQVRGAMKVLDDEVPSGYFEALPIRALARLGDPSMDTTTTEPAATKGNIMPPPVAPPVADAPREEDSGLHDIRSLAQSTKQRLSRKITAAPPMEDDVLASSSAGWKAVALPEPAKMISLPELEQLPSKKQIKEQIKAAKVAKAEAPAAAPTRAPTHLDESKPVAVAVAPAASSSFGANIAARGQAKSKAPLYALLGLGVAAAAGGIIYVKTQGASKTETAVVAKADIAAPAPTAAPIVAPPAAAPAAVPEVAAGSADVAPPVEVPVAPPVAAPSKKGPSKPGNPLAKVVIEGGSKPAAKKQVEPPKGKGDAPKEGEPDFNDLLKEAGVKDPQKAKVALEKKSLSGSDFKAGMGSISGKAQACYAGTQGTAIVKLTVAPSGQVSKASVSGPFAGTAVAACVEAAVRGASFPAWEGGPQSFGYSFLLSN